MKIKIRINGKIKFVDSNQTLLKLIDNLKIPLKKVAIELNREIINKKKIDKVYLKKNDQIEIVHFIGGG
jgi:sulfur carrier protein